MKKRGALRKAKNFEELLNIQYGKKGSKERDDFEAKAQNFVNKAYCLTEGQIAGVKSGLADVKAGKLMSNEDFQKELDEWLA